MSGRAPTTVLFTGYAPVHYLCFQPLHRLLAQRPDFQVFCSGGLRTRTDSTVLYDASGLYTPFALPDTQVLTVEEIRERDFDLVFAANTKLIAPRRAGVKIQLFHGISFRNVALREEIGGWDYYFLVGPYMRRKMDEAGLLDTDDPRGLSIGFPKTDPLRNGTLDRQSIRQRHGFDGRRPVLLYAPTGQKDNSLETMGEEVIQRLTATNRYDILIKPHDHPKRVMDWSARLAPLETTHTRVTREADIIPLLCAADLLISDASSVTNEFALLDRPIVFLDVPKLLAKAAEKNTNLDLQTWGRRGGVIVKRADAVVESVETILGTPQTHGEIRRAMSKDLFYNPGTSGPAALQWLAQKFGSASPSP